MAKRLVKIARELNVGTTTIVDHLHEKGFEIDNKPTAKITEEMEQELLQAFSNSIAIKEKADKIVIGNVRGSGPKKETPDQPVPQEKKVEANGQDAKPKAEAKPVEPVSKEKKEEKPAEKPSKAEEKPAEEAPGKEEVIKEEEKPSVKLKVKGKIELDEKGNPVKPASKQKPRKEEPKAPKTKEETTTPPIEEEKVETPQAETDKVDEPREKTPAKKEKAEVAPTEEGAEAEKEQAEAPQAEASEGEDQKEDATIRAEAPTLKGLKVLGKIDIPKKEKKKKTADKKGDAKKDGDEDSGRRRRRRKRKKVRADDSSGRGKSRRSRKKGKGKDDEESQVSQKEIEEKIKATMARLQGGGKKKRQKLRRDNRERLREKQEQQEQQIEDQNLQLTEFVTVSELASLMSVPVTDVITTCMNLGVIVSINQRLDAEVIELVAEEFGHEVEFISAEEQVLDDEDEPEDDPEDLQHRSPVVTVMGHVDHGKTSLLDYIRQTRVVEGEAGGITQHLGAYRVKVGEDDKMITFIDTPGHEAFTAMRARGAKVTDIAIIIIAADDSIMPQTKEAISHAQAADVPIVFAINKIDKPGANPDRIKQELAAMNLVIEDYGGDIGSADISAKTGENIDDLLERVLLEAEVLELKANPDRNALGVVLEASLDKGRGYVTKMLVQNGSLDIGDPIVAGEYSGKVKAMFNEWGKRVKSAGPSDPVLVLGLDGAPQAGEKFKEMNSEPEARTIATKRAQINREQTNRASKRISLDEIGRRLALGTFKELNLIIKGDVDGSVEALSDELIKLSIETVQVNVIHKAVGQIIESDVLLATASDAIIIGFQVRPSISARRLAEREGVQIKTYSIIYEAIEEIKMAIEGMLEPTKEEKIVAQLEVREIYKISKVGTVAGCFVEEGKINRNTNIRLIRNGIVIFPTKEGQHGEIDSLKRFKDDVKEVKTSMECGVSIKNFNDIKVGDVIEGYEVVEVKQTLEDVR